MRHIHRQLCDSKTAIVSTDTTVTLGIVTELDIPSRVAALVSENYSVEHQRVAVLDKISLDTVRIKHFIGDRFQLVVQLRRRTDKVQFLTDENINRRQKQIVFTAVDGEIILSDPTHLRRIEMDLDLKKSHIPADASQRSHSVFHKADTEDLVILAQKSTHISASAVLHYIYGTGVNGKQLLPSSG